MRIGHCRWLVSLIAVGLAYAQATQSNDRVERGRQFLGLGPTADPVAAARGQKLFGQNCAFCHGQNATGAEGPDLVRSSVVLHDEQGELIGQVVLKGRVERGMPAFAAFTPDQIRDLSAFLHARVEAAANRWSYKVLNVVTGDARQGELFFREHCANCHSASGDLAHIAKKYEPPDLQAQFLYPSAVQVQRTASLLLGDGTKVEGMVKGMDDFTICLADSSNAVHCWPREGIKVQINDPLRGHLALLDVYTNTDMHNVLAYLETLK